MNNMLGYLRDYKRESVLAPLFKMLEATFDLFVPLVMADIVNQIRLGNKSLVGVMIESNIEAGNQSIPADLSQLKYGCSVTDGCVDWATTEKMIRDAAVLLRDVLPDRIDRA